MNLLDSLKTCLQGKKTYLAVAIGLLYLLGVWAGLWKLDESVLAAVGLGSIAFLRAWVKNLLPAVALTGFSLSMVCGSLTGCSTPNAAGRVLSSTALTVDSAMQGWGAWVRAGQATPADEAAVKRAYEVYQASMQVARRAYAAYYNTGDRTIWETAATQLETNRDLLLSIVQQLQQPPIPSAP